MGKVDTQGRVLPCVIRKLVLVSHLVQKLSTVLRGSGRVTLEVIQRVAGCSSHHRPGCKGAKEEQPPSRAC